MATKYIRQGCSDDAYEAALARLKEAHRAVSDLPMTTSNRGAPTVKVGYVDEVLKIARRLSELHVAISDEVFDETGRNPPSSSFYRGGSA